MRRSQMPQSSTGNEMDLSAEETGTTDSGEDSPRGWTDSRPIWPKVLWVGVTAGLIVAFAILHLIGVFGPGAH